MKNSIILTVVAVFVSVFLFSCENDGKSGADGRTVLTHLSDEAAGENCENGGTRVDTGFDENGDGELVENEIVETVYICDGKDGADGYNGTDGEDGTDGDDGSSTLTQVVPIEDGDTGHDCENGGFWVITCEDDGDGSCVEDTATYEAVCNGEDGEEGPKGDQGEPGNDGACYNNAAPEINDIEIDGEKYTGTPILSGSTTAVEIIATDADADVDELFYIVSGSGAFIEQDETGKHKFSLTFNSEGIFSFSVIVSDGCRITAKSFAVDVVCSGDFPNYHADRCWSNQAAVMNYSDAEIYCENLGGHLPAISELRSLMQNCPKTEYPKPDGQDLWCEIEDPGKLAGGDRTSDCAPGCSGDLNVFGSNVQFWSSSVLSNNDGYAWYVNFSSGEVYYVTRNYNGNNVSCVR